MDNKTTQASSKFYLFAGDVYYAQGGARDYKSSFETLKEAVIEAEKGLSEQRYEWFHICDQDMRLVAQSSRTAQC